MARCCSAAGQRGASGSGQQVRRQSSQPTASSGGPAQQAAALSSYRVLVLDRAYHPVGLVNWQHAICLDLLERVEVLEYYDRLLRSAYCRHPLPAVVKSEHVIATKKLSAARVQPTRKNVLRRDNFRCQYCGSQSSLTLDHIVPLSKGGASSWDNLTTACHRCNNEKGDKLLSQTRMKLQTAPKAPPFTSSSLLLSVLSAGGSHLPKEWQAYLDPFQKRLPEVLDDQACPSTTPLRHA